MSTTFKFKRGNSAAAASFTGANGEIYINTDTDQIHVHDGSTQGGAAVMAKTSSPTFTGTVTLPAISANGSTGSAGQVLASNGAGVYWVVQGNSAPEVGEIRYAESAPQNGTWLETNKYYSKASYPDLATKLGSIPDLGGINPLPSARIPLRLAASAPVNFGQMTLAATNGTATVVVDNAGGVRYSNNGTDWYGVMTNANNSAWYEVKWLNNERFVAVGDPGIITSTDGITWDYVQTHSARGSGALKSVTYGGGIYVAVGTGATVNAVVWSNNSANTWYAPASAPSTAVTKVVYGNSVFYALGGSGINGGWTTPDGSNWTSRTSAFGYNQYEVIYEPTTGLFVTGGSSGYGYTSTDAINWTFRTLLTSADVYAIAYGNGKFVAGGVGGALSYSSDGFTWTTVVSNSSARPNIRSIAWVGDKFVAVADGARYRTSTDGVTWSAQSVDQSLTANTSSVVKGSSNGSWISVGTTGSISVSNSGTQTIIGALGWNYNPYVVYRQQKLASYNGSNTYVLASNFGQILVSNTNGDSWTAKVPSTDWYSPFLGSAYVNNTFLVYGNQNGSSGLFQSTDNGATWSMPNNTPAMGNIVKIVYSDGYYVAATSSGLWYTSALGNTWTQGVSGTFVDIAVGNGYFFGITTTTGYYATTTNPGSWTNTGSWSGGNRVLYFNRWYVLASYSVYFNPTSTNIASGWSAYTFGSSGNFYDGAYNSTSGYVCFVGTNGLMVGTSDINSMMSNFSPNSTAAFDSITWTGSYWFATCYSGGGVYYNPNGDLSGEWKTTMGASPFNQVGDLNQYVGGKFISSRNYYLQTSSNGIDWKLVDNVVSYPTTIYRIRKVKDLYIISTNGGLFTSNNGVNYQFNRTIGLYSDIKVSYNGSKYGALTPTVGSVGSFPHLYTSSDGVTWSKHTAEVSFGKVANAATLLTTPLDLVGGGGQWAVRHGIPTPQHNVINLLYTANDTSSVWTGRSWGNQANTFAGQGVSNGSVMAMTVGLDRVAVSNTGGNTWYTKQGVMPYYAEGYWFIDDQVSTDLINFKQAGPAVNVPYSNWIGAISNGHMIIMANANYKYYSNMSGSAPVRLAMNDIKTWGAWPSYNGPVPVTSQSTVLFPQATRSEADAPYGYFECNLYSYDTSTTFFVPPTGNGGPTGFIYAGD